MPTPPLTLRRRPLAPALLVALLGLLPAHAAAAGPDPTGEQIYRQMCVRCHGANGQGTPKNCPHALIGDKSLADLARYIAKSMPEDDPGTCTGDDADKVAAYVYDAFYSRIAQARNQPARVELSRLTVRQYRNAVADVVGSFRPLSPPWDDRRGLRGEYFKSRRMQANQRVFERIDPVVRFDFGVTGPEPADQFEAYDFSVRWEGSVEVAEFYLEKLPRTHGYLDRGIAVK
jgi:mono/diheme cytochrome c family protein